MYDVGSPAARRLRAPRWLDARLVLGVVLVLGSVVLGAKVLAAADTTRPVWAAARDLGAGAPLTADDLHVVHVRMGDAGRYVSGPAPVGYVLARPVGRDEVIPVSALRDPAQPSAATRDVTVPVKVDHWPAGLHAGDLVDVYATPASSGHAAAADAASSGPTARLILARVPVARTPDSRHDVFGGGRDATSVVLRVPQTQVAALVAAVESDEIDLVYVPPLSPVPTGSAASGSPGGSS